MDLMKAAFEGDNAEKLIKIEGPLSQIYKEALDIAYQKPDAPTNEEVVKILSQNVINQDSAGVIATETQVNDFIMGQEILKGLVDGDQAKPTMIYAVSEDDVNEETPKTVNELLGSSEDDQFILVVDRVNPATTTDAKILNDNYNYEKNQAIAAMESAVLKFGGKVAHSFREAMECLK